MNVIVIGCGKVGTALASQLVAENHNVVLVDMSAEKLDKVSQDIDAIRLVGNGASITTQREAGIQTADIFISVTNSDELNLLCCLIARKVGHCHTIARVRNPIYSNEIGFIKEQMGISMIINPELAAANEISRVLRFPSAIQIDTFAKGKIELLKFKVKHEFGLDGLSVMEIDNKYHCDVLISGVERGDEVAIPDGKYIIYGFHHCFAGEFGSIFPEDRTEDQSGLKHDDCGRRNHRLLSGAASGEHEDSREDHRAVQRTL